MELLENERKIINHIRVHGKLRKQDLCGKDGIGCGWTTVAKQVNRLVELGVLESVGTEDVHRRYGKNARLFGLTEDKFLVLGVDVEKQTTTYSLVSLGGQVLKKIEEATPEKQDLESLEAFLLVGLERFLEESAVSLSCMSGIGIGLPIPLGEGADSLIAAIEKRCKLPCVVDNNAYAYCDYIRYDRGFKDFYLIMIRTGVGGGLVVNNSLFRGLGQAGEIGHLDVGGENLCVCGRVGCLEAEVSIPAILKAYSGRREPISLDVILDRYREKEERAIEVMEQLAGGLASALESLKMVLDLPLYVVAGKFGKQGEVLMDAVRRRLENFDHEIRYLEIEEADFQMSPAYLMQKRFLA